MCVFEGKKATGLVTLSQMISDILMEKSESVCVLERVVVAEGIGCQSASPCVVLLKALQLVPLLSQRGFQIQIGAIVGKLKRTVIELWTGRKKSF